MTKYFKEGFSDEIQHKKMHGTTFCVYTYYENDFTGDYTYFISEEVTSFDGVSEKFETLTIPAQDYIKFTNHPGPMPKVVIEM